MVLDDKDFLAWYNSEISRYRDMEWKLTSYSMALSSAILLFAKKSETSSLIAPGVAACTMVIFVGVLLLAEFHVHRRLNEYRSRRDLLLNGDIAHCDKNLNSPLVTGSYDTLYFGSFVLLPVLFGFGAIWILLN